MSTITPKQLVGQLEWRYATKQFDPSRKISPENWSALEDSLVLSASSFGLQPWKFVIVEDPAIREKLVAASWGQRQIADAAHLVVFTVKKNLNEQDVLDFVNRIAEVRGVPVESLKAYSDIMVGFVKNLDAPARIAWAAKQAYIALGTLLTSAAVLGIDACPMEGFDPAKYNEILGLDAQGLSAVVVATVGYRAATDKYAGLKKVRFAREDVIVTVQA
jgi:nitroreductase